MSRYKHKAARAEEFPCFLVTSIGVLEAIAASQKANLSLPRNVYCVRIEQSLPPRSDARGAEAIELPQETSDPKRPQASGPRNKKKLRKSGRRVHGCKNPFLSEEATLSHLTYVILFNRKGIMGPCVLRVLVTIPACSHQRPERHAHSRVRDDGVPVPQVEPIRARPAPASPRRPGTRTGQRRRRHPTPGDPALWTRAKTKAQIRAKGTTERAIHSPHKEKTTSVISKCPAGEFITITVLINSKKKKRIKLQSLPFKIIRKTMKSAPRISVTIFAEMVSCRFARELSCGLSC